MKNYLKKLIAMMLALICVFAFAACTIGGSGEGPDGGEQGGNNDGSGGNTDVPPADEPLDDEEDYRLRFVYSYTAKIVNNNGRTENKKEVKPVKSIYVDLDNNGFDSDLMAEINAISYNGYTFTAWYAEWDAETQTGIGEPFDFSAQTGAITKDITLYGYRSNLAGASSTYELQYEFVDESGVKYISPVNDPEQAVAAVAEALAAEATEGGENTDGGETPEEPAAPVLTLSDVYLYINGSGAMFDFENANEIDVPWYKNVNEVTRIVIDENITRIGKNSFNGFIRMKSVDFGENPKVEVIGSSAFAGCTNSNFRTLVLPDSVKTIEPNAFSATNLRDVVLNNGLEVIEDNAFNKSNKIRTIVVPESLKTVKVGAFNPGQGSSHALSKVYYKGATPADFAKIDVGLDNDWFKDLPTIYYYTEDEDKGTNTEATDFVPYWHYAEVDGEVTDTPVQYCYTISYFIWNSKLPFATFYLPVDIKTAPAVDENGNPIYEQEVDENGELKFDADGNPVYKQELDENGVPKVDADGNPVYKQEIAIVTNDDGVAVLEGIITEELIERQNNLSYNNYKFTNFGNNELKAGMVITDDKSFTGERGNILSEGGGVIWSFDKTTGKLTVEVDNTAVEGGASTAIWDFASTADTAILWTGEKNITTLHMVKSLEIKDGVTHIGKFAFNGLVSVTEVVIPKSVTSIDPAAFDGCSGMFSVYYEGDVNACTGLSNLSGTWADVYSKAEAPTAEDGKWWYKFEDGAKIAWTLDGASITVGGDENMVDFASAEETPWYGAKDKITSVSLVSNVVSLGNNVFNGYTGVTSIQLPNSLRKIPASALANTGVLNNTEAYKNGMLVINNHLVKVDSESDRFKNATHFDVYQGILTIAEGAFEGVMLDTLYVAQSVQAIVPGAFESVLSTVYVQTSKESWTVATEGVDFGYDCDVFFYSDNAPTEEGTWFYMNGSEFVIWGCPHVYGKWSVRTEATCVSEGLEVRTCIYDSTHVEERVIPQSEIHKWMDEPELIEEATCQTNEIWGYLCSKSVTGKCKADDVERRFEVENTKTSHYFKNYVSNGDGTETAECEYKGIGCDETDTRPDANHRDPENPESKTPVHSHHAADAQVELDEIYEIVEDATCTTNAKGYFKCKHEGCDYIFDKNEDGTDAEPVEIPNSATGHDYGDDNICDDCEEPKPAES